MYAPWNPSLVPLPQEPLLAAVRSGARTPTVVHHRAVPGFVARAVTLMRRCPGVMNVTLGRPSPPVVGVPGSPERLTMASAVAAVTRTAATTRTCRALMLRFAVTDGASYLVQARSEAVGARAVPIRGGESRELPGEPIVVVAVFHGAVVGAGSFLGVEAVDAGRLGELEAAQPDPVDRLVGLDVAGVGDPLGGVGPLGLVAFAGRDDVMRLPAAARGVEAVLGKRLVIGAVPEHVVAEDGA